VLFLANGIGESQVNVLDAVVLHHFHNFGCRHYNSSRITAQKSHPPYPLQTPHGGLKKSLDSWYCQEAGIMPRRN
jgi:hypothetical protein